MGPQQNNAEKQIVNNPENGINISNSNTESNLTNRESDRGNVEVLTSDRETISQQVNDALSTTQPVTSNIPATLPIVKNTTSLTPQITSASTPKTADDVDLIEKEWVDRAKKIISETQNEPYLRDKQVTELRQDYKQKRYSHGSDDRGVA
jgi:hypothetical protein